MAQTVVFILMLLVMIIGIVGTVLPGLPGLPMIWGAMLVYGLVEGFRTMTLPFLAITLLVVIASAVAEHYGRIWGAKKYGAGKAGVWGAVIGSLVGLFFMPIGLVLGPFLGAMAFELMVGRPAHEALRAGWGGVIGVLSSALVNFLVAVGLTMAFFIKVIF